MSDTLKAIAARRAEIKREIDELDVLEARTRFAENRHLTIKESCVILEISEATLRNYVSMKKINSAYSLSRECVVISTYDLEREIAKRQKRNTKRRHIQTIA